MESYVESARKRRKLEAVQHPQPLRPNLSTQQISDPNSNVAFQCQTPPEDHGPGEIPNTSSGGFRESRMLDNFSESDDEGGAFRSSKEHSRTSLATSSFLKHTSAFPGPTLVSAIEVPMHSTERQNPFPTGYKAPDEPDFAMTANQPRPRRTPEDPELRNHLQLVDTSVGFSSSNTADNVFLQAVKTAPLFSSSVRSMLRSGSLDPERYGPSNENIFPQYGFLGIRSRNGEIEDDHLRAAGVVDASDMIYANTAAPWSAFICGSQGGGKSYTLSCLLENSLLSASLAGNLPNPLTAIAFHYDKFTSHASTQLCEAAYLCSSGIPVRVLVSPSNIWAMTKSYTNLPGLPANAPRPKVLPLYLREDQLNVSNMMTLMATSKNNRTPLYLEVLYRILRDMAMEKRGTVGLNYNAFKARLDAENFTSDQTGPLGLRLQLLESFMDPAFVNGGSGRPKMSEDDIWKFGQGSLTIVDLSCPFVNDGDACALFSICLSLFLENRGEVGRVVVLDEAHKFLSQSGEALDFTDQLISIICQQRHLATRILIATQEPTLSPRLLDLCNVSIVHRFLSPAWFATLKGHLAGAAYSNDSDNSAESRLFSTIVGLKTGEALLFSPTSMLDVDQDEGVIKELRDGFFKIRIRKRLTADGGKSIMASDKLQCSHTAVDVPIQELTATNGPRPPPAQRGLKRSYPAAQPPISTPYHVGSLQPTNVPMNAHAYMVPSLPPSGLRNTTRLVPAQLPPKQPAPALRAATRSATRTADSVIRETARGAMVRGRDNIRTVSLNQVRSAAALTLNLPQMYFETADRKEHTNNIINAEMVKQEKEWGTGFR